MRKGQYYVIEQTILIGAGLAIALGFVMAFDALRGDIQEQTLEQQTELMSRFISSTSVEMIESGVEGEYRLSLPRTLSGERYFIQLQDGEVTTTSSDATKQSGLFGLKQQISVDGSAQSDAGGVVLSFRDGTLRLQPQ